MSGPSSPRPARPMSIKEITDAAEDFEFRTTIPFKYWARSADTLFQEATFALHDRDIRKAYQMLWRHSVLVLSHLKTHPDAKLPENRALTKPLFKRQQEEVFGLLESLKPQIDRDYNEWQLMNASKKKADAEPEKRPSSYDEFAARDPTLSGNAKILDAADHQELAVSLAQRDFKRRDAARRATRQAGVSEEEEMERRKGGRWEDWEQFGNPANEEDEIRRQIEATRRRLDGTDGGYEETDFRSTTRPVPPPRPPPPSYSYNYPAISRPRAVEWEATPLEPQRMYSPQLPQPPRPPKEDSTTLRQELDAAPPMRPGKEPLPSYMTPLSPSSVSRDVPELPAKEEIAPAPAVKERLTFRPAAYLENGDPIRPVFLPSQLRQAFLDIAADNTRKGLEMCGILCGRPVNNALFISCLVIPEQKCTPDTCETENESVMLDYCINEDLLVVGWIHTHPTQTCFMSSRDLHTQAGYQVMMPESIAIVCSPRHNPSYGIFRLTNPPGLTHILQCTKSETFHQHSIDNLYTGARNPPGHVYHSDKLDFYVKDLRPNR
ncbi:endosome-associated ubiquitin isopeptidase [Colletotrichum truncatum]|uniref:Endosome-associated ubiquitin isopeptidase n=1 Tax=Colletotrichum truncatum TaxID=5467 RepID=A0ACC3YXV7_COLTU|nr:endosome-associated ubiquitin isopeptidase [Colletotrichum truncatum]KAF6790897.1 endosome-associated ubiquitin isopeptidase [Colletotrichum truncatum]